MILRKKMKVFLNIRLFQNDQVKNSFRIFVKIAKTKRFFVSNQRFFSLLFLRGTSCLLFVVITPTLDECLDFGYLPAVIGVLCVRVCVFADLR